MKTPKLPLDLFSHAAAFVARVDAFEMVNTPGFIMASRVEEGKITLQLPSYWNDLSDLCKSELLSHEAAHWGFGHHLRTLDLLRAKYGNLESENVEHQLKLKHAAMKFNVVCDCAIHYNGSDALASTVPELIRIMGESVNPPTYENLQLPPCPPEIAFELLKDEASHNGGCRSLVYFEIDGSIESQDVVEVLSLELGLMLPDSLKHKAGTQPGRRLSIPELPPMPKWIRQVLDLLWHRTVKMDRNKSWRRHSRISELLPGNILSEGLDVRVMLDASGSVFTPALLGQFLSVLGNTPELMCSDVVVFDAKCEPAIPITNKQAVLDAVKGKGGGTLIAKAGESRETGRPIVWLTDGCSADGFPEPHTDLEIWVVPQGAPVPNGALVVRMEK